MPSKRVVQTDVLVIGGGIAGCFAAINARESGLDVILVDKGYAGKSGSSIAASGLWMVFNPEWGHDFNASMDFVNTRSEYINNRNWTEIILKDSWDTFQDLVSWGVEFAVGLDEIKDYWNTHLIGKRRPAGVEDPPFGSVPLKHRKVAPTLRKQAEKVGVKIIDRAIVTDLLKCDGKVVGAIGFPVDSYDLYVFKAKATIMSGGNSGLRSPGYHTSMLTGDAEGMAYRTGAEITGKEFPDTHFNLANYPAWKSNAHFYIPYPGFTDIHGTSLNVVAGFSLSMEFFIHTGKGPILYNLDSATPDDITSIQEFVRKRGNPIEAERIGLDPTRGGKYPIIGGSSAGVSSQQTSGIWVIDTKCATSVPGLYAAGDCCGTRACGAVHTAGGWGLTGAAVTGKRAGRGAAEYALQSKEPTIDEGELARLTKTIYEPAERKGGFSPKWVTQLLQNTMMPYFILHIKHDSRLKSALTMVEFLRDNMVPKLMVRDPHELRLAHETKNMVLNAEMMLRASLSRTESRGVHYREDCPRRDDPTWLAWIKLKDENGRMKVLKEDISQEWWPDLSKPYEERYTLRFPGESTRSI